MRFRKKIQNFGKKKISSGNFWCYFATFTALFLLQFQNQPTLILRKSWNQYTSYVLFERHLTKLSGSSPWQKYILGSSLNITFIQLSTAQSDRAVEYTDRISAEGYNPPTTTTNKCPEYGIKISYGEAPIMLELCGMRGTPSLPLLPGQLWPRVGAPNRALSMSQIELFDI